MKRTVAVLGASRDRAKFGNKSLRAHAAAGWQAYAVNPSAREVEGERSYPSLASVPGELDRITVYLPPQLTGELLPEIAQRRAGEVYFNPGSADETVLAEARRLEIPAVDGCSIRALGLDPADF